jgi:hypothetical protein
VIPVAISIAIPVAIPIPVDPLHRQGVATKPDGQVNLGILGPPKVDRYEEDPGTVSYFCRDYLGAGH